MKERFHRSSRLLFVLTWLVWTGSFTYLWFSLASRHGFLHLSVFGSPLTVSGEFLEGGELPPFKFLQKIELAVSRFAAPPPHHVSQALPAPRSPALLAAKYIFVREDMAIAPLAPLYCGPYLVLERRTKFFRLQLGTGRM